MDGNAKKGKKQITIIVNTKSMTVEKDDISYEEIVALEYGQYEENPNIAYTVLYFKGEKPKGELVKGESVKAKEDMIFNVTKSDKS